MLGRPIYGASPFWPVVAGATVLVVVHRLIGVATARFPVLERIAKGRAYVVWQDGALDERAMLRTEISPRDLDAAARRQRHRATRAEVDEIRVETSGELSVVDRRP